MQVDTLVYTEKMYMLMVWKELSSQLYQSCDKLFSIFDVKTSLQFGGDPGWRNIYICVH